MLKLNPAGLLFSLLWLLAFLAPKKIIVSMFKNINEFNGVKSNITSKTIKFYKFICLVGIIFGLYLAYTTS